MAHGSFWKNSVDAEYFSWHYSHLAEHGNCRLLVGKYCHMVSWLIVPEMKDRTALEVDAMFEADLLCSQFKIWKPEVLPSKDEALRV